MDMTTLVRKVGRLFGDTDQIVIQNTDIFDWVNEAQLKVVRETGCLGAQLTPVASAFPVSLPADFLIGKRVVYGNVPLKMITIDELDDKAIDRTQTGTPMYYYIWAGAYHLYPADTSTDSTQCQIDYVKVPAVIDDLSDPLSLPVGYHEDLVKFCLMRAHDRNENSNAKKDSKAEFDELLGQRKEETFNPDDDYMVIRDDPDAWY